MSDDGLKERSERLLRLALNDPKAEFRDGQYEAIDALVSDRARLLVVQRTGWGKSLVYFLATKILRERGYGPTLLISPLIALMRNQVAAANRIGTRAETINSQNEKEWAAIREKLEANETDILLISPERLANDEFRETFLTPIVSRIGLFVVDEAHCISDWGHDFRPDYRRITRILQALPANIPVLATTATANDRVVEDISDQLGSRLRVMRGPLVRESLSLQNLVMPDPSERLAWLAQRLPELPGSGIIYALTIRDAQLIADWLRSRELNVEPYWGAQDASERIDLENALLNNEVKALVATSALGMGFDKPDLGFVIHFQRPNSVVHYYQQVGRAGRAIDNAYGILLAGCEDKEIAEYFFRTAFPPESHFESILEILKSSPDGADFSMLERKTNLKRREIEKALKILAIRTPAFAVKEENRWHATAIPYEPDSVKIEKITAIRHQEQERMDRYIQSRECLMAFLASELDDPQPRPCHRCAVCRGEPLLPETRSEDLVHRAAIFIRERDRVIEPRKRWPADAMLESYGWSGEIKSWLKAKPGRALCDWGDGGWSKLVKEGKQVSGRFDDRLVEASTRLIRDRWRPDPFPKWVTCVPSLDHPELVRIFARRISERLGLSFIECVKKAKATKPQKEMRNSYRQATNLIGAFEVDSALCMPEPVLLIDDMTDSRWTLTILTALLRQAGSGPVYPFALADVSQAEG